MAFPPSDGDGRAVDGAGRARDTGGDETTVLPPVDGDPALVRPYVREAGTEEPFDEDRAEATGPAVWAADAEPTTVLPPVPPASAGPAPTAPAAFAAGAPGGAGGPLRRAALPPRAAKADKGPGKALALAGGAVALILIGTGTALLTRPSGAPAVQAAAPSTDATSASPAASVSASPSPTPSASRRHSPKPSPTPSRRPSSTPSRSASPSSPSPSGSPSPRSTSLSLGSTGPAVSTLQQDLRQLWIDRRNPTGVYDDRTAQDVSTFQTWYNVQGDPPGVYGPNSQAKMAQVLAGKGNGNGNGG